MLIAVLFTALLLLHFCTMIFYVVKLWLCEGLTDAAVNGGLIPFYFGYFEHVHGILKIQSASIVYINCHWKSDPGIVGTNWIKPCCLCYAVAKQVTLHAWHYGNAVCHSGSLLPVPLTPWTPFRDGPLSKLTLFGQHWPGGSWQVLTKTGSIPLDTASPSGAVWLAADSAHCPGSPDPGSVQGLGQDGWINNVCESNIRSNESTGLVDTQTCGTYSAINSNLRFMMMLH